MKKLTIFLALLLFVGFSVQAQMQITGTVTGAEDGLSVPGVSVVVRDNPTIGTTTNVDGEYSLTVPSETEALLFSFVGMKTQEVIIGGRSVIDVQMEAEVLEMDEVVVTALGISREKKALGYSVQQISGDELNQVQQTDALSALQGRVAGVQIRSTTNMGGSSKIMIRGASSMMGDNNPLIIVDGVPLDNSNYNSTDAQAGYGGVDYGNMLNDLAPSEIESLSVLKGAAAALYGSRAANGVIIITTKSAKKGKEGFSVDFNSAIDFEQVYLMPIMQNKYGGGAVISDADGGVNGFEQVNIDGTDYLVPQYAVDESWGPKYDANVSVLHWDAFSPESYPDQYLQARPWVASPNDVETYWDLGVSYKNSIGISKTGVNYGVRFAYTNTTATGTMPGSEMNKNAFKLAANAELTDKLSVNANLNFATNYTKGRPEIGYGDNSVGQKFFQWGQRQLDFDRLEDYKNIDGTQRTWNRKLYDDPTPKYSDNPYWTTYENYPEDTRDRFYGNISLNYQINENLSLNGGVYGDTYAFYVRDRIASGSQAQDFYREIVRSRSEYNYEARLNYTKDFGELNFNGIAGGNKRDVRYDRNNGITSGGLIVPNIYSLTNSNDDPILEDYTEEKQVNSLFAQTSFSYARFMNLELSVRNDWSSALPEDNNSYFYYGVSGSFVATEVFDIPYVDLAKVRLGYTQVGNDTDPYRIAATYYYDPNGSFQGAPRLFVNNDLPNANLKAETTTTSEVGLDLNMFVNRLDLSVTYFNKATTDQIIGLETPKSSGYDSKFINAGELSSKGWEFTLGGAPLKTKDFEWQLRFNYTKTKIVVEELYGDLKSLDIQRGPFGAVYLRASVGDEYGQLWGYDYLYDDNGDKVVSASGYFRSTDRLVPLGSVYPDYNLGISNSFKYKDFDLGFLIDIQKGGKFYSLTHAWSMYSGMLEESAAVNDKGNEIRDPVADGGGILLDGVIGDVAFNDDGTYTVTNVVANDVYVEGANWAHRHYHGYGTPSAQSVFDADYIKLREVSLGYTITKPLFDGLVKQVRVSLYGRNLATWGLAQEGFDPEMTVVGSGNIQGIDGGLQPSTRAFGINLKLQF